MFNLLDRHLYLQMIIDVSIENPCLINIRTSVFPFCLLLEEISEMNITICFLAFSKLIFF